MFDQDSPEKKDYACRLFETEVSAGRAVVSTQVLQEFYVTVTRKLSVPLDPKTAEEVVRNLSLLRVIQIDVERILGAMARGRRMKISFWDSLIIEAALSAGANRLLTEDLNHGQVIDGLKIENPFWH
ncbi:MAG: PIN domain-containing protein [Deltaproteobacteria bacterium]|nr:PIN domain-containing protein [Deltaproteobacteria bacterium]MBW2127275.1 PIN domain-containing protein [Deltaproteobacteria bacterium]